MQIILNIFVRLLQHNYLMAQKSTVTNNGKKGGNLEGKPHKNKQGQDVGGIKAVVTDANNRPVELEGGEVIINKEASKKHWKELSRINQSAGGGVPISKPVDPHDEDPEEYSKGGKIQFNPNKLPNKWILKYAQKIKENHPEIWKKGGNIYGNQAFKNLERVAERGYWLDSEEWFYIKWRSFVARHKGDFRIAGVVAMLKWVDKVDKGWQYMKNLIEDEIKKIEAKKSKKEKGGWSVSKDQRMSRGGDLKASREKNSFVTYRLKNQKGKGYKGLYKKLFTLLNKDSIFSECYEEYSYYDGNDMIVTCSWGLEGELPKGITEVEDEEYKNGGRVAPTTSANDVPPYTVQKSDNNGELYISKPTAKGYQQWRKFKGQLLKIGQEVTVNQVNGIIEGINPTEPEKYKVRLKNGNTRIVDTSKTTINVLPKGTESKASSQKISGYQVGDKGIYNGKKPVPIEISKITGANVYFINEETGKQKRSQKENFERLFMPSALTGGTKPTELSEEEFIEHANEEIKSWNEEIESWESKEPLEFKRTTPKLTPIEEIEVGDTIEFNLSSNSPRFRAQVEEEESYGKFIKLNGKPYNGARFRLEQLVDIQKIEYLSGRKQKPNASVKPESGEKPDYYNLFKTNYEVMEYQNNEVVAVVLESFVKMVDEDRLMSTENINEFDYIIDSLR